MSYEGKHALVLGLGESGLAMAQWLARCGARVRVADTRTEPARLAALRSAVPGVEFVCGEFDPALLEVIDFVTLSPGLAPRRELAVIVPAAAEQGIPVWGEIELFAQALAQLKEERGYAPKVIAITGTNGKTTVTSLTGLLCRRAGLSTRVAGNINPAALDVLREALQEDDLPQAWVLGQQTVRVLNRDDATVMQMAAPTAPLVTFGTGEPKDPDSFGLVNERGVLWLAHAAAGEEIEKKRKKHEAAEPVEVSLSRLMPADALHIRGLHNAANALAALALCRAIGLPLAPLLHGLREYKGEPHRVELVTTIDGIEYYDDSKGTNVGATVAALSGLGKAFSGESNRIVLIAGGDGKGQDFAPLAEPVSRYVRAVVMIGRDAARIRMAIEPAGVDMADCRTLPEAVERAAQYAQAGDCVLLSPACASLDMFTNYAHRAQVFIDSVRELALAKGQDL
ncbi:MAG: UDP-N-acetylmuramoyl-L-alanine--D-glutamate ligase [Massilia sp.]|nr:UDP-N-acetylmuramoyl-L-alanine--D-glutamate ligase [Massilia sp.]